LVGAESTANVTDIQVVGKEQAMDFGKLEEEAKQVIDERGGMKSVEEDAMEVKDIATGEGSLTEKAEKAAEALKDPGAPGDDAAAPKA
jgi:hypothetical protein